jgi:hypothetical protein
MNANASNEVGGRARTPVHLWIVAVLSLLWNLMGAFDYLATQTQMESYMSKFTQEQLDYFYSIPAWAVSGWAIAVWSSVVGSVGLLLRKRWAEWAFCLSLVGMAVSTIHSFFLSNGLEIMGGGAVLFSIVIWVVAIFLYVYSRNQAKAGVLT